MEVLEDGRVFIDCGPVSMVVTVAAGGKIVPGAAQEAEKIVWDALKEMGEDLENLKQKQDMICSEKLSAAGKEMLSSVQRTGDHTLTPMAAVAGTMADRVADGLFKPGVDKVIVNNGGDIALRLSGRESVSIGILSNINGVGGMRTVTVRSSDGIGGICTSGLGGRSHTRGIADSVTVFGRTCRHADACATLIANSSFVNCPEVSAVRAGEIDPLSDIADLTVVTSVERLPEKVIRQGLHQMERAMEEQVGRGNIVYASANIQGRFIDYPCSHPYAGNIEKNKDGKQRLTKVHERGNV